MGMDESAFALKMRDIVTELVRKEVDRLRPRHRYGKVTSIDRKNYVCNVQYSGETTPVQVKMGSVQPVRVGQIVRVEGTLTERYVADVMGPSYSPLAAKLLIANNDFGQTTSTTYTSTLTGSIGQVTGTFTAPPSGNAMLLLACRINNSTTSGAWAECGLLVTGSDGTVFENGNDGHTVFSSVLVAGSSPGFVVMMVTGMTPGDLITVTTQFRVNVNTNTGGYDSIYVHVIPSG
jgi:hypothetical protein